MSYTTDIQHVPPGDTPRLTLYKVLEDYRKEIERLKVEVPALRTEVADLKADMERMFQALRDLQTTTLPLNVYGGIKNE